MTIDLCKNEESITKLQVKNDFGEYEDLNDTRIYNVTMPTYLATGGDGYEIIKGKILIEPIKNKKTKT